MFWKRTDIIAIFFTEISMILRTNSFSAEVSIYYIAPVLKYGPDHVGRFEEK